MTTPFLRFIAAALLVGAAATAIPTPAPAAQGDCGQPVTNGSKPTASDALAVLKFAVGQSIAGCQAEPCICDVNGNGTTTASDALQTLKAAVGSTPLACECGPCNNNGTCDSGETPENCPDDCPGPDGDPCTSAILTTLSGSDLDTGWTGIAHDSDLIEGAEIMFNTLRRCSDNNAPCLRDSDCGSNNCVATCDCNGDVTCEITGPVGQKYCLTDLKECNTNSDCVNNAACVVTFGPPLPLSSGGNPVCVVTLFNGELTGTANTATGEAVTSARLRSRVFLGEGIDQPCPRCGRLDQNPEIGDQFTCEDGQFPGAACIVEGVSPDFGGVSRDCPPPLADNISGQGLSVIFDEVSTGTVSKTAQLPCTGTQYLSHPSRGNGKCIDNNAACTTNSDCMRCTGDPATTCTSNAQCTGKGTCAEAPEQPISCGHWCHCGFCTTGGVQNPDLPCFDGSDCPANHTCEVGNASIASAPNNPQKGSNECTADGFVCGESDSERCANTLYGRCSLEDFRNCVAGSDTCELNNAGECVLDFKQCFEPRITRAGSPSPLGSYCRLNGESCNTNGDCGSAGGECVEDASAPETAALFCVPQTTNGAINSAGGITGPGSVRLNSFIEVCRCGDGETGCAEQCDDGDNDNGDGCDEFCQDE